MFPMRYEILTPDQYPELDAFVLSHPQGGFTQLSDWRKVKSNWGFEAIVCRDEDGRILGSASVLIQKIPLIGTSFLYCPRGPVCDPHDRGVLRTLKEGADGLARGNVRVHRLAAELAREGFGFLLCVRVVHIDEPAVPREGAGDRRADAARTAGDERRFHISASLH